MEDFLKFLAIAGVIAFGIFRQFSKEKEKNAENERPMSNPPYDTYERELPPVVKKPQQQAPNTKYQKPILPDEGVRVTKASHTPTIPSISVSPPIQESEEAGDSEFSIHTAEEAKRAIIWSEILQRKY